MGAATVRDVTIRLQVQAQPFKIKAPDISPVTATLQRVEKETDATLNRIAKKQITVQQQVNAGVSTVRNTGNAAQMLQTGDALKQAGEGAFHFARGLAFMTAQSEDDLALAVRRIAYVQGMYDLFKGGFEVVKGLTVAHRSLAAAQAVTAATATTSTATVGTMSVAMNVATTSAQRLWAALLGPVGWAALAAGVIAGAFAWKRYGDSVDEARSKLEKQVSQINAVREAERQLQEMQNRTNRVGSAALRDKNLRDVDLNSPRMFPQERIARIEADALSDRQRRALDIIGEGRAGDIKGVSGDPGSFLKLLKDTSRPEDARALIKGIGSGVRPAVEGATKSTGISMFDGLVGVSVDDPNDKENQLKAVDNESARERNQLEKEVQKHENLRQAGESQLQFVRLHAEQLNKQELTLRDIVKSEQERQKAIEAGVRAENSRGLTDIEKVGRMEPHDQARLKSIADKIKAGGGNADVLNRDELNWLDETGLSQQKISRLFINRGNAAGAQGILKALGSDNVTAQEEAAGAGFEGESRRDVLNRQMASSKATEQRGESQLQKTLQHISETRKLEVEYVKQLGDNSDLLDALKTALAMRDKQVADLKADITNVGAGVALVNHRQAVGAMHRAQ